MTVYLRFGIMTSASVFEGSGVDLNKYTMRARNEIDLKNGRTSLKYALTYNLHKQ